VIVPFGYWREFHVECAPKHLETLIRRVIVCKPTSSPHDCKLVFQSHINTNAAVGFRSIYTRVCWLQRQSNRSDLVKPTLFLLNSWNVLLQHKSAVDWRNEHGILLISIALFNSTSCRHSSDSVPLDRSLYACAALLWNLKEESVMLSTAEKTVLKQVPRHSKGEV
jgi:hypothetical protein